LSKFVQKHSVGGISPSKFVQKHLVGGISPKKFVQKHSVGGISPKKRLRQPSAGAYGQKRRRRKGKRSFGGRGKTVNEKRRPDIRIRGTRPTIQKLFGIYFGGYREYVSDDFVSSLDEHSKLCED